MAVTTLVFALLVCSLAQDQAVEYTVTTLYNSDDCSANLISVSAFIVGDFLGSSDTCIEQPCGALSDGYSGKTECLADPYAYTISDGLQTQFFNTTDCTGITSSYTAIALGACIPAGIKSTKVASCGSTINYDNPNCTEPGSEITVPVLDVYPCIDIGGTSILPSCGALCFHEDTLISYEGQKFTLAQLQTAEAPICAIPHIVKANGVKISTTCPGSLRLTHDHLVYTQDGLRTAGSIKAGDFLFADMEEQTVCEVTKVEVEAAQTYFGLNCEESIVLADGYKTSTFGIFHEVPAMWMKYASKILGVHTASALGDAFATVLNKINLI